jgi:uncharacterized repeat protein (TIGR03803 family)
MAQAAGGVTLNTLFSFGTNYTNLDGLGPAAGLIQGTDGSLYGTTPSGGTNGLGTVFKITTNAVYTNFFSFNDTNGATPAGALVQGSDGNLYGVTTDGGAYELGTVFKITTNGLLTTLISFNGTNGANPGTTLAAATNGVLYGTTQNGGTNDPYLGGDGTVFKITTNGVFSSIYSFANGTDGANPVAGLTRGKDGNFYGTTQSGGTNGDGSVFKITTNGVFTTLYSFKGGNDGSTPSAELILGKDGNFYGTASAGGSNDVDLGGDGTIFKVTPAGVLTSLHSFNTTNGDYPQTPLVQGTDNLLYGTTPSGGLFDLGIGFKISTNGVFTQLLSFNGADGAQPQAGLVQASDGNYYGTTTINGVFNILNGNGIVYRMTTNGAITVLYVFGDVNTNGSTPVAGLLLGPDGDFYGTTTYGGSNHGSFGSVFKLATNGTYTVLASFNGTNGAYPEAGLVLGPGGNLYGTTACGGTNSITNGGAGTIFKVTTNGVLTSLASFNVTDGATPLAGLALAADGNFYGTTAYGGTNNLAAGGYGTVFRASTNGTLTRLHSFNNTNGANPLGGLAVGPDGNLYGTTENGGTIDLANGGDGTIFKITTSGTLTRLHSFNVTNGANPAAGLAVGTNGLLYGTTQFGGTNDLDSGGDGTIFSISTNGTFSSVYSFANGNDGANPAAALLLGADDNFYGTASTDGAGGSGVFFQLTPTGTLTPLYSFTGLDDGGPPVGSLAEGAAGYFYGATESGGTNDAGTLFQFYVNPFPFVVTDPQSATDFIGATIRFTVEAIGAAPLQYQWQRGSTNLTDIGNVSGSHTSTLTLTNIALSDAAGYHVIVSNSYGSVTSAVGTLTVLNPFPPNVSTEDASPVGINSATLNASVTPDGASTETWFEWGLTTNYNNTTSMTNVGAGGDPASVSLDLTGLQSFSIYHFAAVAGNSLGTNFGADLTFLTPGTLSNVNLTPLTSFDGTNAAGPQSSLMQTSNGVFYGTTYSGGTYDDGTVFQITSNGTLNVLLSFDSTNGANPAAGLVLGLDGQLYGTTEAGGTNDMDNGGDGTVFKITTNGAMTTLWSFNVSNGASPDAPLVLGSDGNFYGTTTFGGLFDVADGGDGTIFKITTNGAFTSLLSFNVTNGANPVGALVQGLDGNFYSTTSAGGTNDIDSGGDGTVFSITPGGTLTSIYSFSGNGDGMDPEAGLTLGPNGVFYGTTAAGGDFGEGTVFSITTNGTLTTLYSFTGGLDGSTPLAPLTLGADGNFYGTTSDGGAGYGTLFVMSPGGELASLVLFDSDSYGANPQAGLVLGLDGGLYGSAQTGGTNGSGTVFRFSVQPLPDIVAEPVSVTNFTGTTVKFGVAAVGAPPLQYRWQRASSNLTDAGRVSGSQTSTLTLSNITLADSGSYNVIVSNSFGAVTSAVVTLTAVSPFPPAVTTEAADPVTIAGATLNATVTSDGAPTAVWFVYGPTTNYTSMTAVTNVGSGGDPVFVSLYLAGLQSFATYHFAAAAANAVGTNIGADMSFLTPGASSNVTFTPLVSFDGTNAGSPEGALLEAPDGNFYGTTYSGGDNNDGTVYKISAGGALTILYSFDGTSGANPICALVPGPDGQLYGTTYSGGTNDVNNGGDGTVFKITTNGAITSLLSFNVTNGANPACSLMLGPDGNFYGTTMAGGIYDVTNGGDGTVFKISSSGIFSNLVSFDGTNGNVPQGALTLGFDGNYYGATAYGGTNDVANGGDGTIFKIAADGTLTSLFSFNATNGANPVGGLVQAANGLLYGVTQNGGTNVLFFGGNGTVFSITTNGLLTTLYSFTDGADGANPQGPLVLGADGNFYGTTGDGAVNDNGTIFQVTPSGALTTLVLLDSGDYGANPAAGLLAGPGGVFFGTDQSGGTNGSGVVFSFLIQPAAPIFQQISSSGTAITLLWTAVPGRTYQLQYITNVAATNWLTITNITVAAATASATDSIAGYAQKFYRVVQLP